MKRLHQTLQNGKRFSLPRLSGLSNALLIIGLSATLLCSLSLLLPIRQIEAEHPSRAEEYRIVLLQSALASAMIVTGGTLLSDVILKESEKD